MPTKKPRLSLTMDEHVYETFTRLAKAQNRSVSAVVGDVLGSAEAPLRRVALFLEGLEAHRKVGEQGHADVLEQFQRTLDDTERSVVSALGNLGDLLTQADAFAGAGQPPHGNTGVRSVPAGSAGSPKAKKKPGKTKG